MRSKPLGRYYISQHSSIHEFFFSTDLYLTRRNDIIFLFKTPINIPSVLLKRPLHFRFTNESHRLYQFFFRYIPSQRPNVLSFRVPGVYLANKRGDCTSDRCTVQLTRLTTTHSSGAYKCEVSTEGPKFDVVFDTTNVTVAGNYND